MKDDSGTCICCGCEPCCRSTAEVSKSAVYNDIRTIGELRDFLNKLPPGADDKTITMEGSALGTVYFNEDGLEFVSAGRLA